MVGGAEGCYTILDLKRRVRAAGKGLKVGVGGKYLLKEPLTLLSLCRFPLGPRHGRWNVCTCMPVGEWECL